MRQKIKLFLSLCLILTTITCIGLLFPSKQKVRAASPATITLSPTQDTFVASTSATTVHGADIHLMLRSVSDILMQFDLSAIPRTATIQSAVLNLYTDTATEPSPSDVVPHIVAMHTPWVETEATWNNSAANTPWPVLGGRDYDLWSFAHIDGKSLGPINQWSTSDVTLLVQSWVTGIFPNYGFGIQSAGGSNIVTVTSKEFSDPTLRPHLDIKYTDSGTLTIPDSTVIAPEALAQNDSHILADINTTSVPYVLDDFQELGQKYFYLGNWPTSESSQANYRTFIDMANARGLKVILNVNFSNVAGMTSEQIVAYGADLARSLGNKVFVYDMGTENNNCWIGPRTESCSPLNFFTPATSFFQGIKQGNPQARTAITQLGATAPQTYLEEGLPYGSADWADSWGWGAAYSVHDFEGAFTAINNFAGRRAAAKWAVAKGAAANPPHLITWQEEGMIDTIIPEAQRAKMFMIKSIRDMYAGNAPSEWFKLYNLPGSSDTQFGIVTVPVLTVSDTGRVLTRDWANRVKSPSFYTMKNFNNYLDPSQWAYVNVGILSSSPTTLAKMAFKKDNNNLNLVVWNATNTPTATLDPGITTDLTLADYGLTPTKIVDPITGNLRALSTSDYTQADNKLTIKNVEVTDYPKIITLTKDPNAANVPVVHKRVDKITASTGEIITYTIDYSNPSATTTFQSATIKDPIPAGTTYIQNSLTVPGNFDGSQIIVNLGSLAPGASGSLSFQVQINPQ